MIEKLPSDVLYKIIENFSTQELHQLLMVSRYFYRAINSSRFWNKKILLSKNEILSFYPKLNDIDVSLVAAAKLGLPAYMMTFIKKGANVNVRVFENVYNNIYYRPIHFAAWSGNIACVKLLVKKGAKFLLTNPREYHNSPLHFAAASGNPMCVEYFLKAGIPVNQKSQPSFLGWNWTPLQHAVYYNHVQCYHLLRRYGADIHIKNPDDYQAIHWASDNGSLECVRLLIQDGADVNAYNEDGVTALEFALLSGHLEVIKELVVHGADTRLPCFHDNFLLPLQVAIMYDYYEIAEFLLEHDSTLIDAIAGRLSSVWHFADKTVLQMTAHWGDAKAIRFLLKYRPDPHYACKKGKTALEYAYENGNAESIQLIYDYIIERDFEFFSISAYEYLFDLLPKYLVFKIIEYLNHKEIHYLAMQSHYLYTTIHSDLFWQPKIIQCQKEFQAKYPYLREIDALLLSACSFGNARHVKKIINKGADVNVRFAINDRDALNPLHIASQAGNLQCIKQLVNAGASVLGDASLRSYNSPMHFAVAGRNINCVRFFTEIGVPVDHKNRCHPEGFYFTALHLAVKRNDILCYKLLKAAGANIKSGDGDLYQPIHVACISGSIDCLNLLINDGANMNACNEDGYTPLRVAIDKRQLSCIMALLQSGADARRPVDHVHFLLPLQYALTKGLIEIARIFLDYDPTLIDSVFKDYGEDFYRGDKTALHLMAHQRNSEAIQFLLAYKPNPHIATHRGKMAIDYAIEARHYDCESLLYDYILAWDMEHNSICLENTPNINM